MVIYSKSKNSVLITILLIVFVAEVIVMAILYWLNLESPVLESIIDGLLLATLSAPFIYYFLIEELSNKNINLVEILRKQKIAEDALIDSQNELQFLSEKLISSEEEQRKALAFELHDSIGQSIFAIKLGIENTLSEHGDEMSVPLKNNLLKEVKKLRTAAEEVRHISVNLRPSMLDDLGLIPTLSWLVRDMQQLRPSLSITISLEVVESDIPENLKVVVFRIVQEALTNIVKHSDANVATISIIKKDGLYLQIKDDGKGFQKEKNTKRGGLGLHSMRERTKLSEGNMSVNSELNKGTSIEVVWMDVN